MVIEISRQELKWNTIKFVNKSLFKKIMINTLNRFAYFNKISEIELSILLTDDCNITQLNKNFRNKDKPTNVLSFPDTELSHWQDILAFESDLHYIYLGDIAFSYQTIMEESCAQGKTFKNHFIHLCVHSILHLIGFDHDEDKNAEIMELTEVEILKNFAIYNVY
ncbi:MAG: rRNA maturation RNase YbeY [Rickettsiaceae bacterium]|nr:MAG: rRNA maturation RNase YbeY [Rickettsiaceae bacterium]